MTITYPRSLPSVVHLALFSLTVTPLAACSPEQSSTTNLPPQGTSAGFAAPGAGAAASSAAGNTSSAAAGTSATTSNAGALATGSGGVSAAGTGGTTAAVSGTGAAVAGASSGAGNAGTLAAGAGGTEPTASTDVLNESGCAVGPVPDEARTRLELDPFYEKYADANGISVVASSKPADRALTLACMLLNEMLSERKDVRDALISNKSYFAIVATAEQTTDIPEYSDLPDYYNTRARGLGGLVGLCAEESILCDRTKDRWYGESICVHEYSHTISIYGLYSADKTFSKRLDSAFQASKSAGLWENTYAAQDPQEYWAEGVQNWYYTNLKSVPPNGVHGPLHTKEQLQENDPTLYGLIDELLPEKTEWPDCYRNEKP